MVEPVKANGQEIWIGCSGYQYKHWRGSFYPADLPQKGWLEYYARYFPTVELNNTFYLLPAEKTFIGWHDKSPEEFLFAVKANRFITHMKKLKEPAEHLGRLFDRAYLLGPKLGPVLYQLPPRWRYNEERFEEFLRALPSGVQHAVEVREQSWLNDSFFRLLTAYKVAFCIASLPDYVAPEVATAPFVYLRFHGSGNMYDYNYPDEELSHWRDRILRFTSEGHAVYAYFNNDPNTWAVWNALSLTHMVREAA